MTDWRGPFDLKIEHVSKAPFGVQQAAIFVNDTLDLAWASARQVFEEAATPEIALAIYDRMASRMAVVVEEAQKEIENARKEMEEEEEA